MSRRNALSKRRHLTSRSQRVVHAKLARKASARPTAAGAFVPEGHPRNLAFPQPLSGPSTRR